MKSFCLPSSTVGGWQKSGVKSGLVTLMGSLGSQSGMFAELRPTRRSLRKKSFAGVLKVSMCQFWEVCLSGTIRMPNP